DDDDEVRANAVASLARSGAPDALASIALRSADPSALVRRAAVDALAEMAMPTEAGGHLVGPLLHDPDPVVSARAAGMFARAARDPAAVSVLARLARHADAGVRAAAVRSMRGVDEPRLSEVVRAAATDPAAPVRAAAAHAAPSVDPADALDVLVEALADDHPAVRRAAVDGLAELGAPALDPVLAALEIPARRAGAVLALERLPIGGHDDAIRRFVRDRVAAAVERHRLAAAIDASDGSMGLLRDSLVHRAHEDALVALRASALVGRRTSIDVALEHLTARDPGQRANALEVIESVADRHLVRPLLELWEPSPGRPATVGDLMARLARDPDGWIRACAELASMHAATLAPTHDRGGTMPTTLPTLSTMERVLFLRKVPLFAGLPPPDLQPIAAIAREETFDDGDVLAEQGDVGYDMYVVVDGRVAVVARDRDGDRTLAVRTSGEVVGEMAVITFEPRMAALVAVGPVRALTLSRAQFEAILRERPETSLGVIRVLCQRLAAAGGSPDG
ncbi:MAG TPA: HEAT repeat domain-containing protein, partial [Actinomycetota bacterium]